MPNNEGNRYYWGLHSENATGENVGAVLDDLSDIEVTPEEGLDDEHKAIIVEYDEGLGRNKFKLGAAGSKVEIPGNDNQIVVADGEGNAKANTGVYTFGDSEHPEDQVSFTLAELKALKALLTQIPIQVVQSASEATEQGIMYFVDGGGN